MKLTTLFATLAALLPVMAADTGSYTVSGLSTRKKAITAAGGTALDMAIAMLETYCPIFPSPSLHLFPFLTLLHLSPASAAPTS